MKTKKLKTRFLYLVMVCLAVVLSLSFIIPALQTEQNIDGDIVSNVDTNQVSGEIYQGAYFAKSVNERPAEAQSLSYKGGSVFLEPDSIYIMQGGTIQNHHNVYGGAIFVSAGAVCTIHNGRITNCSATYGGAIYVAAGGVLNIYSGTITGNSATYGPSIYIETGATVNISEDTVIDDNSIDGVYSTAPSISEDTISVGDVSLNFELHYVEFGSYPQSYVGGSMNSTLESWYLSSSPAVVKTYSFWNSYYNKTWTWSQYQYLDGEMYVRGSAQAADSDSVYLDGTAAKTGATTWFKVEPIKWIILNYDKYISGENNYIQVMSWFVLASNLKFQDSSNLWYMSYLRRWLNASSYDPSTSGGAFTGTCVGFYDTAFTDDEKNIIDIVEVKNNITSNYTDGVGVSTYDKVYCLSYQEATTGIFSVQKRRFTNASDFAIGNNVWVGNVTSVQTSYSVKETRYWLRSAGGASSDVCTIEKDGYISKAYQTYNINYGIRPVIHIKMRY